MTTKKDTTHETPCDDLKALTERITKIEQKLWIIIAMLALLFGGGKALDVATATKMVVAAPAEQPAGEQTAKVQP